MRSLFKEGSSGMDHRDTIGKTTEAFGRLVELIRSLRSENGCPWDRKQTPLTLHPYILEEYHELVQAMQSGGSNEIVDEMGDLIFLVVFIAYVFEQQGLGSLTQVLDSVIEKMRRRHPHVFGETQVENAQEVIDNWRKIKATEENIQQRVSLLDGVPRSLPALSRAQKLATRAARVGFDWTRPSEVFVKIEEELNELKQALDSGCQTGTREELGDVLFVIANAGRHLNVNCEAALNETSDKFERRFRHIEARLLAMGKTIEQAGLPDMDSLWDEAKTLESK
jgi:MazG family protein